MTPFEYPVGVPCWVETFQTDPPSAGPVPPEVPPHWNVNFAVQDADVIAARAADLGGTVLMEPTDTPGFRSAVLIDPEGAAFSVSQPVPGG